MENNYVFWFIGLPGSGKSTLAMRVMESLREQGTELEYIRPDALTKEAELERKYTAEERDLFYRVTAVMVKRLVKYNHVLVDSVTHEQKWRALARRLIPNYIEVYIKCPLELAMQRESNRDDNLVIADMYKKALDRLKTGTQYLDSRSELRDVRTRSVRPYDGLGEVIGVDVPFEEPENPEITIINDDKISLAEATEILSKRIKEYLD